MKNNINRKLNLKKLISNRRTVNQSISYKLNKLSLKTNRNKNAKK